MAAEVMVMVGVAICTLGDTATAGVVTLMVVMAGGITVTGIPAMVAGGVAAGTLMVLERAGALGQQQVGFGSATSLTAPDWTFWGCVERIDPAAVYPPNL